MKKAYIEMAGETVVNLKEAQLNFVDRNGKESNEISEALQKIISYEEKVLSLEDEINKALQKAVRILEEDIQAQFDEGIRKECEECNGEGGHYIVKKAPDSIRPAHSKDGGWYAEIEIPIFIKCEICKGKGYLMRGWI